NCSFIEIVSTIIAGSHSSGIYANGCDYNLSISSNRIFGCETGIFVENTENCIINMNRIYYNRFGIHLLDDTNSNMITQNSLGWNNNSGNRFGDNIDGGNVVDSGSDNYWDGNSWSDYNSVDAWYEIGGGSNPQDYPRDLNPSLLLDLSSPVITISDIDRVIEGDSIAFLSWRIIEEFPASFELYRNTIAIDEGYLTTDILVQPLGLLSYGTHNFTIIIRDAVGNIETLEHDIRVVSPVVEIFLILSLGVCICVFTILPLDYLLRIRKRKMIDELESDEPEDSILEPSQLLE
ncbi:MAG: NosD domain-containing protein, partial [Candidatus Thorarchaeota archaeon]